MFEELSDKIIGMDEINPNTVSKLVAESSSLVALRSYGYVF